MKREETSTTLNLAGSGQVLMNSTMGLHINSGMLQSLNGNETAQGGVTNK